jgi:hypothetical protein
MTLDVDVQVPDRCNPTKEKFDHTHYTLDDGVTILPNGVLLLVYERDATGNMTEGYAYAPGQWLGVTITEHQE